MCVCVEEVVLKGGLLNMYCSCLLPPRCVVPNEGGGVGIRTTSAVVLVACIRDYKRTPALALLGTGMGEELSIGSVSSRVEGEAGALFVARGVWCVV